MFHSFLDDEQSIQPRALKAFNSSFPTKCVSSHKDGRDS